MMEIDDETLMALADGEITGDAAARLEARIAADPDLAARYALFSESAHRVKAAALAHPESAVSPDLSARIRGMATSAAEVPETPVPLRRRMPRWQPVAMAASVCLAVGLATGLVLAPDARAPVGPVLTAELRERLNTLPSGAQSELSDGERLTVVASFTDRAGAFCREYETRRPGATGYVSVACHADEVWDLRFAMATSVDANGYTPAAALEALDAFYVATGATQPLDPEEEQRFLEQASSREVSE